MNKEFKRIAEAIDEWVKHNKNNVIFHGGFVEFKKNCDVKDTLLIAYGDKETINISIEGMKEGIEKEKDDFINW